MKKYLPLLLGLLVVSGVYAKDKKRQEVDSLGNPIKTGWNFGILPSVAYDADFGFQGGLLTNIYYYGDGSQYPEYIHSIYVEAAYTTKHHGIFRVNYDSKYLIPNHRLTLDATYLPDAMLDFYGFNGYQSLYTKEFSVWNKDYSKMDTALYRSRVYNKFRRDLIRVAGDIEGNIYGEHLKWDVGLGVLGFLSNDVDEPLLNGKNAYDPTLPNYAQKPLNPNEPGLYEKYQSWGLISADEARGGWHPYGRVGITYDSRDKRQGPNKGIYTDAFFTYNAGFNTSYYGQQAQFNNLQFNFTFRHYVPVYKDKSGRDRITFAYRIGTQNLIAGNTPFYLNNYLNTLFIQRVYYEGLGGGNSVRGLLAHRINAKGYLFANIEFRFRVVNFDIGRQHFFIGLNPFFDMGMVTQPYSLDELVQRNLGLNSLSDAIAAANMSNGTSDQMSTYFMTDSADPTQLDNSKVYLPHMVAGLGLKIGMNENFVLSVDWAMPFDKQDNHKWANFYVKMGYLF